MSNKPTTAGTYQFNYHPDTSSPGKKPEDIWGGFSQGAEGNCVTVSAANFKGSDAAMMTDANFLYAVSAKRAQMENNDNHARGSYSAALRSLNDGEYGGEGLTRLGLKNFMRRGNLADLANGSVGTLERNGHSMAVIGGREETFGTRGGEAWPGEVWVLV